ncbi:MAG TPA: Hpt domain-containing protein [Symbiobacteriaceae bacterium]|nr:Hpt domain-containing protein [Symbiobacteriaceae bacterium]
MFNSPEFQALRREYLQSVVERVAFLREQTARLRSGELGELKALRQEIHKSRGSGGFYGFTDLSKAAAAAEDQLVLTIDGEIDRDDQALATLVERVIAAAEAAARELGMP